MTEAYRQGFIGKCAEQGVDGVRVIAELEKQAAPFYRQALKTGTKYGNRFWELLSGSKARSMTSKVKDLRSLRSGYANAINSGIAPKMNQQYASLRKAVGEDIKNRMRDLDSEKLKVLLTRLGLGTGVVGGGALMLGGSSKPKNPWDRYLGEYLA